MFDIVHHLRISASPEIVWRALTTVDGLKGWWTLGETIVTGSPGTIGDFSFQSRGVTTKLAVVDLDCPGRVKWRALQSNAPGGWEGTQISFDLIPDGTGTVIQFAHRGFAYDDDGYRKVTAGWEYYLGQLKQFVEGHA